MVLRWWSWSRVKATRHSMAGSSRESRMVRDSNLSAYDGDDRTGEIIYV